jgi:four helix bundle protein
MGICFSTLSHSNSHYFRLYLHCFFAQAHFFLAVKNHVSTMFDFEKLDVYKKAKAFNAGIRDFIKNTKLDNTTKDQLRRAALSIVLNLAEGSGRFTHPDRRNFYIIARSSVFECVAILDVLKGESVIDESAFSGFYSSADELSRILFAMIRNLQQSR